MFFSALFKKNRGFEIAQQLYGSVVTQSREPVFFAVLGVPDTTMGRFDMLALHVYLLARRFSKESTDQGREVSQLVFDLFVDDLDRALRQLGIGDTSVPKKKKKMVRSFYGQIEDFDEPLANGDLTKVRNAVEARYFSKSKNGKPDKLAEYMAQCSVFLEGQDMENLMTGNLNWPNVVEIS